MNNKTKQLDWRKERTVETVDKDAKIVLSDGTHLPASELNEKADVSHINDKIDEIGKQMSNIEESVGDNLDNIFEIREELSDKVDDSPHDGKIYGRKNGVWIEAADETLANTVAQHSIEIQTLYNNSGDLSNLLTDNKDNLVSAINDAANSNISASVVTIQLNTEVDSVSLKGVNLRVYIEDNESLIITTDANGKATIVVDGGAKVEILFPHITGCEDIPSITRFATKGLITINATYRAHSIKYELLSLHIYKWQGSHQDNFVNCPVTIIIDGTENQFYTDEDGRIEKEIAFGTQYTVRIPVIDDLFVYGRKYEWDFTAESPHRELVVNYHDVEVGLFMCCSDGAEYTKDEFIASGRPGSDVVMFKISNAQLALKTPAAPNGNIFGIDLNDVVDGTYNNNILQWANQTVQFTSCDTKRSVDGFDRTAKIVNEGIEIGLLTPAATFCLGKQFNLGGTKLNGFLGATIQHLAVISNEAELNAMLAVVRPESARNFSSLMSIRKWTIDQSNANYALYATSNVDYDYGTTKISSLAVLPFYAF